MVGLIGSAIAGGLGEAAGAAADQAKGYIDDQRKADLAGQLSKMDEDKQLRIDEVTRKRKMDDDITRTDPNGTLFKNKLEGDKQVGLLQGEIERKNMSEYATDAGARAGVRAKAQDQYVESALSHAQAGMINEELATAKAVHAAQQILAKTTDPTERAKIEGQINDLNYSLEGRSKKLTVDIDQIKLNNAKEAETLRKEYGTATPERQAQIEKNIELLTGKNSEKYLPIAVKDNLGQPTGEYKVFDTHRGSFVEPNQDKAQSPAKAPWQQYMLTTTGAETQKTTAAGPTVSTGGKTSAANVAQESQPATNVPKEAESVGKLLDAARGELDALRNVMPSGAALRKDPEAVNKWKEKRDQLRKRVDDLTAQYQEQLPPEYSGAAFRK